MAIVCVERGRVRRGLTVVEVIAVVVAIGVILLSMMLVTRTRVGCTMTHATKDAANVRGIQMGLALFAQNNQDRYPQPSLLDRADSTVRLPPETDPAGKDTTANIISMLIYSNHFGPEICISTAETNGNIRQIRNYEYADPRLAVDPKKALWDPKFAADFTGNNDGHFSYAHMLPSGKRLTQWVNAFNADEAIVGNRGPFISNVGGGASPEVMPIFDAGSNTLRIHGGPETWEGNVCYNDNHSNFETSLWGSDGATYSDARGTKWHDLFHYDEPDDAGGLNRYLGVFVRDSATGALKPIWD